MSIILVAGGVNAKCPENDGPMMRVENTRFFIYHHPNNRKYHHSFTAAKKLCAKIPNMRMAQIRNMTTFHHVGRLLERWVKDNRAVDTWCKLLEILILNIID